MRMRRMLAMALVTAALAAPAPMAHASQADLAEVRAATAVYHRTAAAQADGWDLVPGLDHCFESPGVGGMGVHYINLDLFDTVTDPRQPEALVYAPNRQGRLVLAAVEWIVPADAWAATDHDGPPSVLGRPMHLNETLGVWVLHAWVFRHNPAGMFEDWNPTVTCP
jgi:hypothetical protein